MLTDELTAADVEALSPDDLRRRYEGALAEVVDRVGREAVVERTTVDLDVVAALDAALNDDGDTAADDVVATGLDDDESPSVTLEEAAAILALESGDFDAETLHAELLDRLMMGMTTAVVDVETLAAAVDPNRSPNEIQQQIEGRAPMTVAEYARLRHFLANRGA